MARRRQTEVTGFAYIPSVVSGSFFMHGNSKTDPVVLNKPERNNNNPLPSYVCQLHLNVQAIYSAACFPPAARAETKIAGGGHLADNGSEHSGLSFYLITVLLLFPSRSNFDPALHAIRAG